MFDRLKKWAKRKKKRGPQFITPENEYLFDSDYDYYAKSSYNEPPMQPAPCKKSSDNSRETDTEVTHSSGSSSGGYGGGSSYSSDSGSSYHDSDNNSGNL